MTDPRKQALRRTARQGRAALGAAWRAATSAEAMRRVLELPETRAARVVALYASFRDEVETHALIAELIRTKGCVALPRTRRELLLPKRG